MNSLTGLDFDEFEDAMRGVDGQYIPVGKNTLSWQLSDIALADLEIMRGRNGGGAIYGGACRSENFGLFLPIFDTPAVAVNGTRMQGAMLAWLAPDRDFHIYNSDAIDWIGVAIGRTAVAHWLGLTHEDFRRDMSDHLVGQVDAASIARIRDLVDRVPGVQTPDARLDEAAIDMLHAQLSWAIYEAVQSMDATTPPAQGRPRLPRREILDRALQVIDAAGNGPVHLSDLGRATRVSARTLHAIFMDQFGLSPYRYLVLRRLRKIHDALKAAAPGETVAGVCSRFGVWDFGRFSGLHRRIYGASPAAVLGKRKTARPTSH